MIKFFCTKQPSVVLKIQEFVAMECYATPIKKKKHRRFVERNIWKRRQDKKKREKIQTETVYNYSGIELTKPMMSLLNRGSCLISQRTSFILDW